MNNKLLATALLSAAAVLAVTSSTSAQEAIAESSPAPLVVKFK